MVPTAIIHRNTAEKSTIGLYGEYNKISTTNKNDDY